MSNIPTLAGTGAGRAGSYRPVLRLRQNEAGRDFAVGDVHGCFSALRSALDSAGFDPGAGDRLISVGDLVDRGPESADVLSWLGQPWFFAVAGNHEDFCLRHDAGSVSDGLYSQNGGDWFLRLPDHLARRPFLEAFGRLPVAIEVETAGGVVGVVHADVTFGDWSLFTAVLESVDWLPVGHGWCPDDPGIAQMVDDAIWSRERVDKRDASGVFGVRALLVGHTPAPDRLVLGNVHYLDSGGWLPGRGPLRLVDCATLLAPDGAA